MNIKAGGLWVLLFITVCHVVGLLLFYKGFLLKRVVIPEYSKCRHNETGASETESHQRFGTSCNAYPRQFKRVVWLLIDAWRYDFAIYDETLDSVPVYRNKMPFIRELLRDSPQNAKLFKFVADPPTTTMQRLKALTTGSLPTFIDISSNFNSYETEEDNLPHQAKRNKRNFTFMGDDTWLGLYPDTMTKIFDYPSLNVKDIHTVDNGVIAHLIPELEKYDAELVIGHFLGVDHIGHTYGPSHTTMGKKLLQMDKVLKSVVTAMDSNTIVFVFGDHGMTPTGDHGGETPLETDAALLVYTPRPLFDAKQLWGEIREYPIFQLSSPRFYLSTATRYNLGVESLGRSVYQIDLVPTVALALGLPIPFSSLGMVIPEVLLPYQEDQRQIKNEEFISTNGFEGRVTFEFLKALSINAKQLQVYLDTYVRHAGDFPSADYRALKEKLNHAESLHSATRESNRKSDVGQRGLTKVAGAYVEYMKEVKRTCQGIWAKFDDGPIRRGLVLLVLTLLISPLFLLNVHHSIRSLKRAAPYGFGIGAVMGSAIVFTGQVHVDVSLAGLVLLVEPLFFYSLVIVALLFAWHMRQSIFAKLKLIISLQGMVRNLSLLHVMSLAITVLYSISLLSNSFVLYEGNMVVFFLQSMVVCFALKKLQLQCKVSSKSDFKRYFLLEIPRELAPFFPLMLCIRLTKLFHSCRDMQVGCEASTFTLALASASEYLGLLTGLRCLASCSAVCLVPFGLAFFLRRNRHARLLSRWLLLVSKYGLPLASLCVAGFWAMQALPQSKLEALPHWQHVLLPRVVYITCCIAVAICVLRPYQRQTKMSINNGASDANQTREIRLDKPDDLDSRDMKRRELGSRIDSEDLEDSQATEDNSSSIPMAAAMELGVDNAFAVVILILMVAIWLPIAMLLNDAIALAAVLMVVQVALLVRALRGWKEASLPVSVFWGLMCCQFFFGFGHQATVSSVRVEAAFVGVHGEVTGTNVPLAGLLVGLNTLASQVLFGLGLPLLLLLEDSVARQNKISKLLTFGLQYVTFHSVKMVISVIAASLHRRHLMIWAVFSPRFMYESAFQATTDLCIVLVFLLVRKLES